MNSPDVDIPTYFDEKDWTSNYIIESQDMCFKGNLIACLHVCNRVTTY